MTAKEQLERILKDIESPVGGPLQRANALCKAIGYKGGQFYQGSSLEQFFDDNEVAYDAIVALIKLHANLYLEETEDEIVDAKYTSVFDGDITVTTDCKYNVDTQLVFDIQDSDCDVPGANALTDQFVTLASGAELREEDGVDFDY